MFLYLAGSLPLSEMAWESGAKKFKDTDIDRVYQPGISPRLAIADLEAGISR